jgi:hypothetical protein
MDNVDGDETLPLTKIVNGVKNLDRIVAQKLRGG